MRQHSAVYTFYLSDKEQGLEWLMKAVEQNYGKAQYVLSNYYYHNNDREKWVEWMKKAADNGHDEARKSWEIYSS